LIQQDVAIQYDRESQEKQDAKRKINKILSDKDKKINCLKKHSQILLTEVKKLRHKDISILKVDKGTSIYASESRNF
jgi:hypothetical protein